LKPKKPRKQPEQEFQRNTAHLLGLILHSPVEWTAIGHGGGGPVRGAILKAMGLKAGFPDIIISVPFQNGMLKTSLMVGLELKSPDGVLSHSQKLQHAALERSNWHLFVCRTPEEVLAALDTAGVPHLPYRLWPSGAVQIVKVKKEKAYV
jgi:hypothetical protein